LRNTSGIRCWGDNQSGQLGDLTTTDSTTPRSPLFNTPTPTALSGAVAIAAATFNTCARMFDGNVLCWGRNTGGQLGINSSTVTQSSQPRAMLTSEVVALATGNHSCVARANGTVACTGGNVSGQIGDGTVTNRLLPTTSTGVSTALSISAGAFHTCGIRGNGQAICWGDNAQGQYGDGTTTSRPTPGLGPTLTNLTALAAGAFHTCAIDAAGQVFCWGAGGSGVLGDGTFANRLAPVAVPSFAMNIDPTGTLVSARAVKVSVLALCEEGAHLLLRVTLAQGGSVGHGTAVERCTSAMDRHPLRIRAQGPSGFGAGPARAELEGVVFRNGKVVDVQQWTRNITLVEGTYPIGE
jgi:alpha-tubulin suppressor-like RCC1 family protein